MAPRTAKTSDNHEALVRARAHQLWEDEGRPEGRADEHWHKAAALVASEAEASAKPARKTAEKPAKAAAKPAAKSAKTAAKPAAKSSAETAKPAAKIEPVETPVADLAPAAEATGAKRTRRVRAANGKAHDTASEPAPEPVKAESAAKAPRKAPARKTAAKSA